MVRLTSSFDAVEGSHPTASQFAKSSQFSPTPFRESGHAEVVIGETFILFSYI